MIIKRVFIDLQPRGEYRTSCIDAKQERQEKDEHFSLHLLNRLVGLDETFYLHNIRDFIS